MTVNPQQFQEALDIVKRSRGIIGGEDARKVFKAANIRSWPIQGLDRLEIAEKVGALSPKETLNTAQSQLHGPTIREYMKDIPEENPYDSSDDRKYLPEVYTSKRGSKWIEEGHHRIIASRFRGDYGMEVYKGNLHY